MSPPRFVMYRLTIPTGCVIFGLVHIIANIKLPITDAFSTQDIFFLSASLLRHILEDNFKLTGNGQKLVYNPVC